MCARQGSPVSSTLVSFFHSFLRKYAISSYLPVLGQFSAFFSCAGAHTQGQLLGPGREGSGLLLLAQTRRVSMRPALAARTAGAWVQGQRWARQGVGQKVATGAPPLAGVLQPCCFGPGADR